MVKKIRGTKGALAAVRLEASMLMLLEAEARAKHVSRSHLVREAIRAFLEKASGVS